MKFKKGDWVIAERSECIAQIVSINTHKNEYVVEYSNMNYGVMCYPFELFDSHWELYNGTTNSLINKHVCDCGAIKTYGHNIPAFFHFDYCKLYRKKQ